MKMKMMMTRKQKSLNKVMQKKWALKDYYLVYLFFAWITHKGTDLWSSIERVYKKINPRVFGLYLAEDDSYEPQVTWKI